MNRKKVILIGGGGHCKVVISQLRKLPNFEIEGIIDNNKTLKSTVMGIKVLGTDSDLKNFYKRGVYYALITVGSVKDNIKRYELFKMAKEIGFKFPLVISPEANVDKSVKIGEGTTIMPGCVINVDASIGKNCIINTGAIIEHDCKIGNHVHVASGASLSGSIELGDLSFIGVNSTVIQGLRIGRNVIIGAGSTIIDDMPDNVVVVGNPGKIVNRKE